MTWGEPPWCLCHRDNVWLRFFESNGSVMTTLSKKLTAAVDPRGHSKVSTEVWPIHYSGEGGYILISLCHLNADG